MQYQGGAISGPCTNVIVWSGVVYIPCFRVWRYHYGAWKLGINLFVVRIGFFFTYTSVVSRENHDSQCSGQISQEESASGDRVNARERP